MIDFKWLMDLCIFAACLCVFLLWSWLAGGIYLALAHQHFTDASILTIFQYLFFYGDRRGVLSLISESCVIALGVFVGVPGFIWYMLNEKRALHGSARFAILNEIKEAGLFSGQGIIVGRYEKFLLPTRYLTFEGSQHAIISAPTRSGKGVGIVIPNLLAWPESVVVLDIKQENWDITSRYRQSKGQECYLFNPLCADYRSHRYNPLSYISDDQNFRIDDIQKIASMLYPDKPGTDIIWTSTPRALFLGIVLFLIETGRPVTIGQVLRETLMPGDAATYFKVQMEKYQLSPACMRGLNAFTSISADDTRAGIMGSVRSALELWMNPILDAATCVNDFDLRDVRKKKMSIYVGVTPDNLGRVAPLLNLFFQQLIDLNTRELPSQNKDLKYTCMLLMDEFTAMGRIEILSKGISYIAGYNLRMLPIIQSPSQLDEVYGKEAASTFKTNHALQIVYPPKPSEIQAAKDISEWLGYQTVKSASENKGKNPFFSKSATQSVSDQRRALLLPQEITGLKKHREIVVAEGTPPILGHKVFYYNDHNFMNRLKEVSPSLRELGHRLPSRKKFEQVIRSGEMSAEVPNIDFKEVQAAEVGPTRTVTYQEDGSRLGSITFYDTAVDSAEFNGLEEKDFDAKFAEMFLSGEFK
jgi:type IV secretion system protein VirD4